MNILYFPHKSKANKAGLSPLKIRITCGPGDTAEISTGKQIDYKLWDIERKRVTGKSPQADIINKFIVNSENKLLKIESDLERGDLPITAEIVRNIYKGVHVKQYGLIQVLDIHNDLLKQKIGQKGVSPTTVKKYVSLRKKIGYFLELKYKRKEVFITELDLDFIESFWHFLLTTGKEINGHFTSAMDQESACGIITRIKKIAKIGLRKQGIGINPFDDFKCSFEKESKMPLEMEEINAIVNKNIKIERLDRVRDRAVVGLFTGMAYSDIQSATTDMITTDIHGNKFINKGRVKTGELSMIPLWPPVIAIIEKYKDDPTIKDGNFLFPRLSLQKTNAYLQEIADICGITKKLTTHVFRHSFGNMYLNSGGTLENLARILGHSNTKTTRTYARRNKATISTETNQVKDNIFGHLNQIEEERKIS